MKTDSNTLNLSTLGDMGLYVHIPFCKQKCMYCDFPAYQNLQDYYETYVYALVQEMDLWVSEHPESKERSIDTIYFGGGTPTELSIQQLQMIVDKIKSTFTIEIVIYLLIESFIFLTNSEKERRKSNLEKNISDIQNEIRTMEDEYYEY